MSTETVTQSASMLTEFGWLAVIFALTVVCYWLAGLLIERAKQRQAKADVQRIVDEMYREEAEKARERGLAAISGNQRWGQR